MKKYRANIFELFKRENKSTYAKIQINLCLSSLMQNKELMRLIRKNLHQKDTDYMKKLKLKLRYKRKKQIDKDILKTLLFNKFIENRQMQLQLR